MRSVIWNIDLRAIQSVACALGVWPPVCDSRFPLEPKPQFILSIEKDGWPELSTTRTMNGTAFLIGQQEIAVRG
jgi:hypothetical protein